MIEARKNEIIAEVEGMAGNLREQVLDLKEAASEDMEEEVDRIDAWLMKPQALATECQELLDKGNASDIVAKSKELQSAMQEIEEIQHNSFASKASIPVFSISDFPLFDIPTDRDKLFGSVTSGELRFPTIRLSNDVVCRAPTFSLTKQFNTEAWNDSLCRKLCVVGKYIVFGGLRHGTFNIRGLDTSQSNLAMWESKYPLECFISEIGEVVLDSENYLAACDMARYTIYLSRLPENTMGVPERQLSVRIGEGMVPGKVTSDNNNNMIVVNVTIKPVTLVIVKTDLKEKMATRTKSLPTGLSHVSALCWAKIEDVNTILVSCAEEKLLISMNQETGEKLLQLSVVASSVAVDSRNLIYCHGPPECQEVNCYNPNGEFNNIRLLKQPRPKSTRCPSQIKGMFIQGAKLVVHWETNGRKPAFGSVYSMCYKCIHPVDIDLCPHSL